MKILVLNSGSSSLKYQLFNMENQEVLAKGLVERIGIDGGKIKHKTATGVKHDIMKLLCTRYLNFWLILSLELWEACLRSMRSDIEWFMEVKALSNQRLLLQE